MHQSPDAGRVSPALAWIRATLAVAWRDVRSITRYKSWFIASFIWPIIFPFSLVFVGRGLAGPNGEGLESFESLASTADYTAFIVLGSLAWMFVNINLWMGGLSLTTDRRRGTFDTHWTMPASKLTLVIGATLASLLLNFLPMVVAIVFYAAVGWLPLAGNFLALIVGVLAVLPFLLGFLLCFSALTIRIREANMLVQVMRTVFAILCGLQFPLSVLPGAVQRIGRVIPLTHFIETVRGVAIMGNSLADHGESLLYLLVSGAVMIVIGVLLFETVRNGVRKRGLVSGY